VWVSKSAEVPVRNRHPFSGAEKSKQGPVLVFPQLLVCLDCGKSEFVIPREELLLLVKGDTAENI